MRRITLCIVAGCAGSAFLAAILTIIALGPSTFFSNSSALLFGTQKEMARGFLLGFTKLGAILGGAIGLIIGVCYALIAALKH